MLTTPTINEEQIKQFKQDGFLLIKNAFSADDIKKIESWATELATMPEKSGAHWVFHETSQIDPDIELISRIEKISPFHNGFAELSDVLKQPMAKLFKEKAALFKEKINFKMPGGDGFKPHQDSQAGWQDYADYFISVMVCIDEATLENGCLQMVSGFQNSGLFREWEPLNDDDMKNMEFINYPTKPGDIVFFDCYTPHASEPNLTDSTRRLYFATYNKLSEGDHLEKYYADKFKSYPPDIDRVTGKEYVFRV
jgi:ectoine hydroxylase-related dioxygenase (phytanoyl-CoA dioxygenase family)